jgi:hypothetical protein
MPMAPDHASRQGNWRTRRTIKEESQLIRAYPLDEENQARRARSINTRVLAESLGRLKTC